MKSGRPTLAIGAVVVAAVGLLAQKAAGAPVSALAVQGAALALGGAVAGGLALSGRRPGPRGAMVLAGVAVLALLVTFGDPGGGGAQRWLAIGPVAVQPSMIVLPFMVWGWSRVRAGWGLAGLVGAAALLMAAQPDAAGCGGLLLALIGAGAARRSVSASEGATAVMALAATVWAATRPDDLPAVAHVERVVVEAFKASPLIGIAAALAMIAVPGLIVWRARSATPDDAATIFGLAGLWLGLTAAAVIANYPAPVVGYGASSALGWLASLGICALWTTPDRPRWAISPCRR
ncbi:FtsW/RodA/SpoVE family cell cycle protein [soil metagenome]